MENLFNEWKKFAHVYIPKQTLVANTPTIIVSSRAIIEDENKKETEVFEKNENFVSDKKKKIGSKKCLSPFQERAAIKNLAIITKFNKEHYKSMKKQKSQTPKIKLLTEEIHESFSNRENNKT